MRYTMQVREPFVRVHERQSSSTKTTNHISSCPTHIVARHPHKPTTAESRIGEKQGFMVENSPREADPPSRAQERAWTAQLSGSPAGSLHKLHLHPHLTT